MTITFREDNSLNYAVLPSLFVENDMSKARIIPLSATNTHSQSATARLNGCASVLKTHSSKLITLGSLKIR